MVDVTPRKSVIKMNAELADADAAIGRSDRIENESNKIKTSKPAEFAANNSPGLFLMHTPKS
jgi:hypothetical protein